MKVLYPLAIFLFLHTTLWGQKIVEHIGIAQTRIDLSNLTVVGQIEISPTVPGKVIVRFDGNCISTPGDRIILAASNTTSWNVNDGNIGVEAVDGDLNRNGFSHTRVYDVNPGSQTFYAVAQNFVETDGDAEASIYASLTVEFIPSTLGITEHLGINETRIDLSNPTVVGQIDISPDVAGKAIVRFDGSCLSTPGDRIVLAASDIPNWSVNDGNVSVEAVDADVNQKGFSHTRVYDVGPGNHSFYAVAHNFVETEGDGEASIYASLTVEFIPSTYGITEHVGINETGIDLTNPTTIGQIDINPSVPGKALVHFNGSCISTPGDRIVLAASDTPDWNVNDGSVGVEAVDSDINRNGFSHTRVYEIGPGNHSFYAVAHNFVETDGDAEASIYASLTVEFIPDESICPDLVVKSLTVTNYSENSIQYSYVVENIGTAPVDLNGPTSSPNDNVSIQAFISADEVFNNAGDLPAGGTSLVSSNNILDPGETFEGSFQGSPAIDLEAFPYLTVKIDWREAVEECEEDNNTLAALIDSSEDCPDLVVKSLTVTSYSESNIQYSYVIENIGTGPADLNGPTNANNDNVSVQAFLSTDEVFNNADDIAAGGSILGASPLPILQPGDTYEGSFGASAAVDLETHPFISLKVDWGEVLEECEEDNNTLAALIDSSEDCPDLVVKSLTVTSYSESNIQYSYVIENIGTGPADLNGPTNANNDNVSVQAFLSADEVFNNADDIAAGGSILGASPLPILQPGETYEGSFGASASVDPGTHPFLTLKIDWGEVLEECEEENNTIVGVVDSSLITSLSLFQQGTLPLKVYPNPLKIGQTIRLVLESKDFDVTLLNSLGQIQYVERNVQVIPTNQLIPGYYWIHIRDRNTGKMGSQGILIQ
ncbi:MAG: CARDB domain-containing protein [Bacteroidota bacterium]